MTAKRSFLHPTAPNSDDYAFQEYGVTEAELDAFVRRTKQRIACHRKAGKMITFSGEIEVDTTG